MDRLDQLFTLVGQAYPLDSTQYPSLTRIRDVDARRFNLTHTLMHLQKSLGGICGEIEEGDHTDELDLDEVKKRTTYAFISMIKFAHTLGMTADELCQAAKEALESDIDDLRTSRPEAGSS